MKVLIGADPEVFVSKDGMIVSGHNLIPGTKKEPFAVKDGAVQVDGMALEFNINPSGSEDSFVHNINSVLKQLSSMVPDHKLLIEATADFSPEYLKTQPPEALELGCDPDFNAYTGHTNEAPDGEGNMRTAAGHIHLGWGEGFDVQDGTHQHACCTLIKQLDIFLGLPSLIFDTNNKRRAMYGKAGAFRPKSYGAEYRVLSNAWVGDEALTRYVYRNAQAATKLLLSGRNLFSEGFDKAQDIINKGDDKEAIAYLKTIPEVEMCHV